MQRLPTWDEYYLEIAKAVAQRSDTGVDSAGTVIVGVDRRMISAGFERAEHAELDALRSVDLRRTSGGTAYITRRPCDDCYAWLASTGLYHLVWPDGGYSRTAAYWAQPQLQVDWNALNVNG